MEEQDLLTPQEFAAKIKNKYPQYSDVEDSVLVEKMIAKYPEYKNQINFETPEAPEVPKGEVAEVDGESVSTSASTTSSLDSTEPKEKQLHPFAQTQFPDLYEEYRRLEKEVAGKPVMYMGEETARMEEIENIFNAQPEKKSTKKLAEGKIAELDAQQDALVEKYSKLDLGGRSIEEVLESDGTYQDIIKQKQPLLNDIAREEVILEQIVKDTNADNDNIFVKAGRVFGIGTGTNAEADETIDLSDKVKEQILIDLQGNETLRSKIGQGYADLSKKEQIISDAKYKVINSEYNRIKGLSANVVADQNLTVEQKNERLAELQGEYNELLFNVGVDEASGLLKHNFKKTVESNKYDEIYGDGGFISDTADAVSTFLEGVVQTGFKGTVGFTANVMSGLGNLVTGAEDDEYTVFDAFSDTVYQLGNTNLLPSSKSVKSSLMDENGDFNIKDSNGNVDAGQTYKVGMKTIAQALPFTLAIVNDVKRGKIKRFDKVFGQMLNPQKNKKLVDRLALIDSAYRHTLSDNLAQAEELGLDRDGQRIFANTLSMAEGMAEMIMPDTRFFKSNVGTALLNTFKGDLKSAATRKAKQMAVKNFVGNMVKEFGEEEVVFATEELLKLALVTGHENSEFWDVAKHKELAATSMMLSGALGGANVKRDFQGNLKSVYTQVSQNINEATDALQHEYDNGLHDDDVRAEIKDAIDWTNNMNLAISKSPESVTAEQIDLLVEKQKVMTEMTNVDDAFKPQYQAKIDELNNKINPKLNEEKESTTDGTGQTDSKAETTDEAATPDTVQTESKEEVVEERTEFQKKSKELADNFRKAKFYKSPSEAMNKLQADPTGLLKFAWDGAVETIATAIETTGNVQAAINKGLKQFTQSDYYKNLKTESKAQARELFVKDAKQAFTALEEAQVKPKKTSTKANIRKTTGQVDTSQKVTTTKNKQYKQMLKDMEKGARLGKKFAETAKREAIKKINEAVKPLIKKHKDNTLYAKAYSRALSAINQYNGKNMAKVDEAISKIETIIEKEALNKSVRKNRKKAKSAVKKLGKTADPIRRILRYKPEWLDEAETKELDNVLQMFSTKWTEDYDVEAVKNLESKLKEKYVENIGERVEAEIDLDKEAEKADKRAIEQKQVSQKMVRVQTGMVDTSEMSKYEKEVVRDFARVDQDYIASLEDAKLRELNKALTALTQDGILVNEIINEHKARFQARVASKTLKGKIGDNIIKTKDNAADAVKKIIGRGKNESAEDIAKKVRKRMLQHIDTVITNFKNNELYTNFIHPFSSKLEKSSNETAEVTATLDTKFRRAKKSRQGSRLKRLGTEVKQGLRIDKATSYEYKMNVMLQLYFRQKEYAANPEFKNNKVFSVADHMKNMNNPRLANNLTVESKEAINKIYEQFKSADGNIDIAKMESYFTQEEMQLIEYMEETLAELAEKSRFTADHIRGESQTFLNNYFPRKSAQIGTEEVMDVLDTAMRGGGVTVKAGSANARAAKKGEALDFATLNNFVQHVGAVNTDFHMSPELKKMNYIATEMATGTQAQKDLGQVLQTITNDMVEAQVKNVNSPINTMTEKFFNVVKRKTFNKVLIDPVKILWDGASTWLPVGVGNLTRQKTMAEARKALPKKAIEMIMRDIGSTQVERIGSRSADIKATSSSAIGKAKFRVANPSMRDNMMDLVNKNIMSDFADNLSKSYYKLVDFQMNGIWRTEFRNQFEKMTGQKVDQNNYQELKNAYPSEMKKAVAFADKMASNYFNTASSAEQKLDVQRAGQGDWKRIVDTFMKSFAFNENSVMWDSIASMFGKGNMSRKDAFRTFAVVNTRAVGYAYLSQMIMQILLNEFADDDEDIEEVSEKALERALWQHGILYGFGNRGNVFNMAAAFIIESGRKMEMENRGEKYNQYENSVLYAMPRRGKITQYTSALGAEGEAIKVAIESFEFGEKLLKKIADGEAPTEEELIEWKTTQWATSLLAQFTGLPTYRSGKLLQKYLENNK